MIKSNVPARTEEAVVSTLTFDTAYNVADMVVRKKYLANLSGYDVIVPDKFDGDISFFHVERIVFDAEEGTGQKLLNVYHALHAAGGSLLMLMSSDGQGVDFLLGTKAKAHTSDATCREVLERSVRGNFPGTKTSLLTKGETEERLDAIFGGDKPCEVTSITCVPAIKRDEEGAAAFSQGMEKLLDSMVGETFSLLIIAEAATPEWTDGLRAGYEGIYTKLAPLAESDFTFGENEGSTIGESLTKSVSESIGENFSHTQSSTESHGTSTSHSKTDSTNIGIMGGIGLPPAFLGLNLGKSFSSSETSGTTDSVGNTEGDTRGGSTTKTTQESKTDLSNFSRGTSRSSRIHFVHRHTKTLMDKIESQLKRLDESDDSGMWKFAAYAIAGDMQTSRAAASTFYALMRGEGSGVESGAVTSWEGVNGRQIMKYLRRMEHPRLSFQGGLEISPAAVISGRELVTGAGFPRKSLPGISVDRCAAFGREVVWRDGRPEHSIRLGCVHHMHSDFEKNALEIDRELLTSHAFVAGSTGTGKSNAICLLLSGLGDIPWMLIEPAKGEYKDQFGGRDDVTVYGTNPQIFPRMLQINPFSFPDGIHVLEHIDRLVEVFGACWPMYAAMPAILHDAIERAYENCGWEIYSSKGVGIFPTFDELLATLPKVIDESGYSGETTSDYKGALVTRVRSLTQGLQGIIFGGDLKLETLFSQKTIIDISRIGSEDTKALIMGMMTLKLSEYHQALSKGSNLALSHVTVMEEAHTLFRRTVVERSQELSNVMGQSVAMLRSAIAEMRTYGEGFILVDQSPALMDEACIRNTNTKIIFRLPDVEDRTIAGQSIGLTQVQTDELARLGRGIAAVYQSGWAEAVLTHTDIFEGGRPMIASVGSWHRTQWRFLGAILGNVDRPLDERESNDIRRWKNSLDISLKASNLAECVLNGETLDDGDRCVLLRYLLGASKFHGKGGMEAAETAIWLLKSRWQIPDNSPFQAKIESIFQKILPP